MRLKNYSLLILLITFLGVNIPSASALTPTNEIDGQTVNYSFTDDNTNEDLLIYTDKAVYQSLDKFTVKMAVTNTTSNDQNVAVQAYFANSKRKIENVSQVTSTKLNQKTITVPDYTSSCTNGEPPCTQVKTGEHQETVYTSERISKTLDTPVSPPTKAKKSVEVVDKSAGVFIKSGETVYLEMTINLHPNKESSFKNEEFFIEAIGDRGGYGHLDPGIAFVKATACTPALSGTTFNCNITATTGNTLFVADHYTNVNLAITVSDSTNTYNFIASTSRGIYTTSSAWYATNITGGSLTLAFTSSGSRTWVPIVMEFSGVDTVSPLIASKVGNSGTSPITSANFTSVPSGSLMVATAGNYYNTGSFSVGATNPTDTAIPTNGTSKGGASDGAGNNAVEYAILGASYSSAMSLAWSGTTYGAIVAAAFTAASGGGATSNGFVSSFALFGDW